MSLAAVAHGEAVTEVLERQLRAANPGRTDGRLVMRTGVPDRLAAGLSAAETRLFDLVTPVLQALDRVLSSNAQTATLNRLVARGLVHLVGFTPSDAAHTLGRQANWTQPPQDSRRSFSPAAATGADRSSARRRKRSASAC